MPVRGISGLSFGINDANMEPYSTPRCSGRAPPKSFWESRFFMHDRPEKFSVESRVAVAGYGARVPTQRLSLLRRYKLSHAPETRRSCRQGRSVGCLATERSVQRA